MRLYSKSQFRIFLFVVFALISANCFAATSVPFVGAGSSTVFRTLGLAAYSQTMCGTNSWTQSSGANGVDNRPGAPSIEGVVWVIWATASGNITTICAFLEVDSVQAARLYLAQPTGTLCLNSQDVGAAGNNLLPNITDTVLTQAAYNAINCQPFNAALSELRAEDAKFDTDEWLVLPPKGYGPGPIGMNVQGSGGPSPIVDFAISGLDPITGEAAKTFAESDVGATPLIVFANAIDTERGGLGSSAFTNIDRFVLSGVLNGTLSRTRDMWPSSGLPCIGPQVFLPSPVSGPWAVMENDIVSSKEVDSTQELGVRIPADNPLDMPEGPCGASRRRFIGEGVTVKEVGAIQDAFSYLPWHTSLFDDVSESTKYVKVDDVDPLYANYTNGNFPVCSLPCPGLVSFNNVLDGGYPLWNIIRAITATPEPPFVATLVSAAQAQTTNYPDYVPSPALLVFRSHFKEYASPHNGYCGTPQSGGDVGGAVLTTQSDQDYCTDTGMELINLRQ